MVVLEIAFRLSPHTNIGTDNPLRLEEVDSAIVFNLELETGKIDPGNGRSIKNPIIIHNADLERCEKFFFCIINLGDVIKRIKGSFISKPVNRLLNKLR